ncbi:hypothetical protein Q6348_07735 [Isoptericola sp. b441]|uniref:Uncharacterized protein n=1 Tax=Actinotalea lenta TaxID=3064654 RepID=A0ABT9D885_9CELL|nr:MULTISPECIES: hypothetical protein [unclassified Isoptericola]MDO8107087.1 hypothetical protein [Isoptericola sp. b441]MDO8121199.1 hypothetical protein [Isoptericola sp. b490]
MSGRHRATSPRWPFVVTSVATLGLVGVSMAPAAAGGGLAPGDSVEGDGIYDANVSISSTGDVRYLVEGSDPVLYGAANDDLNSAVNTKNGCLGAAGGFGDVDRKDSFTFELADTVSDFSLRMLDFGDYNPNHSTNHSVVMTAYDSAGNAIPGATDTLAFTTGTATNPTEMWYTGDACTATEGQPGNYLFSVAGTGIAKVTLEVVQGLDPNIAFTDLNYTLESDLSSELMAGRDGPAVGEVGITHAGDVAYLTVDVDAPWVIYRTHVDVVDDPADFPQTKGGLIPGQFTYLTGPYVPGVSSDSIALPLPDSCTNYVAFHADLLKLSEPGSYWATDVVSALQGTTKDGGPVLPERSDSASALGAPDGVFYSLGFGGSIEVAFGSRIYNSGSADDLAGVEITNGRASYPEEKATVEFLYNGTWYPSADSLTNATEVSFVSLPAGIPYADAVRITDDTDPALHIGSADGFDLDAVKAHQLVDATASGWADTYGVLVGNNWSMYLPYSLSCAQD